MLEPDFKNDDVFTAQYSTPHENTNYRPVNQQIIGDGPMQYMEIYRINRQFYTYWKHFPFPEEAIADFVPCN
ncbi:hypothetical protein G7074_14765 [Pedobacter sp. HDW13]|uniref:hypothetical protein n=1 Tax=Pedobacter sp. HDW13 TaxID=2714940 RepID=UPI0014080812|nr:hypothetical protein [Pedobacter sp. HDW13]QIL40416.1 hypothetical protein G7074_14765 [Pedobacter sp. HDW13]